MSVVTSRGTRAEVGPTPRWRDVAFAMISLMTVSLSLLWWGAASVGLLLLSLPGTLVLAAALALGSHRLLDDEGPLPR